MTTKKDPPDEPESLTSAFTRHNRAMFELNMKMMREVNRNLDRRIDDVSAPPDSERRLKTRTRTTRREP